MKSNFHLKLNIFLLIKFLFFILIIFQVKYLKNKIKKLYSVLNYKYTKLYNNLNLTFYNINKNEKKLL